MNSNQSIFVVEGMTCGGCEKSVTRTVLSVSSVADVKVDRTQNQAVVTWKPGLTAEATQAASQEICSAVEGAGFDCRPA